MEKPIPPPLDQQSPAVSNRTSSGSQEALYCAYEFDFKDIQSGYNDGDLETAPVKSKLILISW